MEGVTVNTMKDGYEAVHVDYPGKIGKGKTPQAAIANLDKIKGRKRKAGTAGAEEPEEDDGAGEAGSEEPKL